ncbi:MAG: glutamate-1-semialdehyde 2,1-aminomutase, partial [Candidatus Sericytochromatia bacterium]
MSAIRLARGFTGREKIVKFAGCYHGHSDMLLAEAGSGIATLGIPGTPGVPAAQVANTLTLPFNDLAAVKTAFEKYPQEIAVVCLEPVAGNMGLVQPADGFLAGLRELCTHYGALLLFDEVMTGFRLAYGGAQERLGVTPDLTCLGKIIGGGLPVGAYGGRREIMLHVAPAGQVYQAGTLSGNPLAMQAGAATLKALKAHTEAYAQLDAKGEFLAAGLRELAHKHGLPVRVNQLGSMFTIFFTEQPVNDYTDAKTSNLTAFKTFFHSLLDQGIYFPPSQFEACFISLAHNQEALDETVKAFDLALEAVAAGS